jgi:hypothetical protein
MALFQYMIGNTDWVALFTRFASLQDADMALLAEVPGLGGGDRSKGKKNRQCLPTVAGFILI